MTNFLGPDCQTHVIFHYFCFGSTRTPKVSPFLDQYVAWFSFNIPKASFEELERALFAVYGKGPFAIRYQGLRGVLEL